MSLYKKYKIRNNKVNFDYKSQQWLRMSKVEDITHYATRLPIKTMLFTFEATIKHFFIHLN